MRSFLPADRWKAVVAEGGGAGSFRDGLVDRRSGQKISDTSPQFTVQVEGRKRSAEFGEMRSGRVERNGATLKHRSDGIVRKAQQ